MWKFWISLAILTAPQLGFAWCEDYARGQSVANLEDPQLNELSGLARSSQARHYWAHNDSGDTSRLFHLNEEGQVQRVEVSRSEFSLDVQDWEDISNARCVDGAYECLLIADFGDNLKRRPYVQFILVRPNAENNALQTEQIFNVTYPDSESMDAEGLIVWGDEAFIFSKEGHISRVFRFDLNGPEQQEAELVGEIPLSLVTAADISPDGQKIMVRGYFFLREYSVLNGDIIAALGSEPKSILMKSERQGEAVTYRAGEAGFLTIGESINAPVNVYECAEVERMEDMGVVADIGIENDMTLADVAPSPTEEDIGLDTGTSTPGTASGTSSCGGGFFLLPFFWWRRRRDRLFGMKLSRV